MRGGVGVAWTLATAAAVGRGRLRWVGVLYVLTVHHKSAEWIDVQTSQFRRHLSEQPYRVVANLEGVGSEHHGKFDAVVPAVGAHAAKLNLLAGVTCATAAPDDLLMFIDGDAFPIADPMPVVREALSRRSFVAVRRDENDGDPQPHPCFAVCSVETWRRVCGDWSGGYEWAHGVTDVGANLLALLRARGEEWEPLLRSNTVDLHPVWYGIYGGVVYHHGAGFRNGLTRADRAHMPAVRRSAVPVVRGVLYRWDQRRLKRWEAEQKARRRFLDADVRRRVLTDPDSVKEWL